MVNAKVLLQPKPPWLLRVDTSQSELTDGMAALAIGEPHQVVVRFVRGWKMRSVQGVFDEFAAAWQFPHYFGENWNAFDECLADLSWVPAAAFVLVIWDSHVLLESDAVELEPFTRILSRVCAEWANPIHAGEAWDRPAIPFHVLFHCSASASGAARPEMEAFLNGLPQLS